jgi:hypothetical protein
MTIKGKRACVSACNIGSVEVYSGSAEITGCTISPTEEDYAAIATFVYEGVVSEYVKFSGCIIRSGKEMFGPVWGNTGISTERIEFANCDFYGLVKPFVQCGRTNAFINCNFYVEEGIGDHLFDKGLGLVNTPDFIVDGCTLHLGENVNELLYVFVLDGSPTVVFNNNRFSNYGYFVLAGTSESVGRIIAHDNIALNTGSGREDGNMTKVIGNTNYIISDHDNMIV